MVTLSFRVGTSDAISVWEKRRYGRTFFLTDMSPSYLPSVWSRVREVLLAVYMVLFAPPIRWPESYALVVCDPIVAYDSLMSRSCKSNISKLLRIASSHGARSIVTQWVRQRPTSTPRDAIDTKGYWSFYVPANQSTVASDVYVPFHTTIIPVTSPNAYTSTTFCDAVRDASTIVLAGVWTESCVLATARAALDRNQHVIVVRDAVSGHGLTAWFTLVALQMAYGSVVRMP